MRLRKYFVIARVSLANTFAYRASLYSSFCFYALFIYVFMSLWRAIYQQGSVHGYTYTQIVWYLIMTELVVFGCRGAVFGGIGEDVRSGSIAYLLNRPVHYVLYQFAQTMGQTALNLVAFGALAVVLGLVFVGPLATLHPWALPFILLTVVLGIVINFFLMMTLGLSAFVMEDNAALFFLYQKLIFMLGMFLPVEFLPLWLQGVAKNLPFSYIAWAPARLFVDFSWPLFYTLISRQLLWAAVSVALTFLCYRGGVRKIHAHGG